jgi:tetratricopeptide (TPR) repeat protein
VDLVVHAWRAKARMLARVGLGARGVAALERALSEDPEDLQTRLDLYTLLLGQRRFEQALVELDQALPRLDPEVRVRLLPARAELLCELLRDAEALATIDEALVHMPDDPRAIYTRGRALALLGNLVEARDAMARVLELEPDNPGAARALAQIEAALT